MPVAAAAVGAVGSIAGGLISSRASSKAADAQVDAADRAAQVQWDMYEQSREDQTPWREAGIQGLEWMQPGLAPGGEFNRLFTMADYQADPGYQFRFNEGQRALESSAAARGMSLSGAALKDLTAYGQDMGSQEYMNAFNRWNNQQTGRFNRLAALAGVGQTATNELSALGRSTAQNVGNLQTQAGNARASGYVGGANAWNSAIGGVTNTLAQMMPQPAGGGVNLYGIRR